MPKSKIQIYFISAIATLVFGTAVPADSVAPECSYSTKLTENKLFVMLARNNYNKCVSQGEEKAVVARSLREKYEFSGLYHENDLKPLWTVDWYSYQVLVSSDGKYLVRTGPWPSDASNEAFSFFSDGKLLKTYSVGDVVRFPSALPHSVSHFQWQKSLQLDNDKNTFEVVTLEDGQFTFSLESGEVIVKKLPIIPPTEALTNVNFYFSNLPIITIGAVIGLIILSWFFKKVIHRASTS